MNNEIERDKIQKIDINKEMKKSYIDYAMSVIVSRALPDVRDGLKPVQRRIVYSMHKNGLYNNQKYRKSATIVGDVIGKYHPHGDLSIYSAMVRFAQPFSMRYPLVDGQGNFGSIDGDSAAAHRYTEAKMSKLSAELLKNIEKETVDFVPNFDGEEQEPSVLPAAFPNLLVNGTMGIAVGMATSIPPHNLAEVIDATVALMENDRISDDELISHVNGPDFPTGAIMLGSSGYRRAYKTGRGSVVLRSKHELEEMDGGKTRIVFTEIPYQVNKARMLEGIANLVKNKLIDGITALRDESNMNGIRVVVECRRDVNVNVLLNQLYKMSSLQSTFSLNMIALVDGEPKLLSLREILTHYIAHQIDVETRRCRFDLRKAEERAHILEAYIKAIDNIDEVIRIIRSSYDDAEEKLMEAFGFTEIQAKAICDLRLRRLQGLEREKIEEELNGLMALIQELKELLSDEGKLKALIVSNLKELKEKYFDERRTDLELNFNEIDIEDLIDEENVTITLTHKGYIKRVPSDTYVKQNRGGRGITGLSTRDEDFVIDLINTSTHNHLMFITNKGRSYILKAYQIPEGSRTAMGTPIVNLLSLDADEKVSALIAIKEFEEDKYLVFLTKQGIIKRTPLSEYGSRRTSGLIAINIREDDELIGCKVSSGNDEFIIVSKNASSIRFNESSVRATSRNTTGVKAMSLRDGDEIVSLSRVSEESAELLVISENGYGKRTPLSEYKNQNRGGLGNLTYKISEKTGAIIGASVVDGTEDIILINSSGIIIRISVSDISVIGRVTSGVKLMKVNEEDRLISFSKLIEEEEDAEEGIEDAFATDSEEEEE